MLKKRRLNQKGMATLEMIPLLVIFVLLVNFSFGFFGVIHTGILQSIAARNYTFETFRHRANLTYLSPLTDTVAFNETQVRLHAALSEDAGDDKNDFIASTRMVDFFTFAKGRAVELQAERNTKLHVNNIQDLDENRRNDQVGANPVWIKSVYGICLNAECKPTN